MAVKLMTENNLEIISLIGGCRGSSDSTLIKMPHRWKSNVAAHIVFVLPHSLHERQVELREKL